MNMRWRMGVAILLAAGTARAGQPQPCSVVHGLVRDAYGYPYVSSAQIRLEHAGTECDRADLVGVLAGGINYRLELDLDSGGTPYAPYAVHTGDTVQIVVTAGGTVQPTLPVSALTVGKPGELVRLDLCTGVDADGDGLPDAWEEELVAQSNGALAGIEAVDPDGDFDGDGLSNRQEFLAGTFAFLPTDLLQIDTAVQAGNNRLKLRFLTSDRITYRVLASDDLRGNGWLPIPFALTEEGALGYEELVGDGAYRDVYVDAAAPVAFLRIATH